MQLIRTITQTGFQMGCMMSEVWMQCDRCDRDLLELWSLVDSPLPHLEKVCGICLGELRAAGVIEKATAPDGSQVAGGQPETWKLEAVSELTAQMLDTLFPVRMPWRAVVSPLDEDSDRAYLYTWTGKGRWMKLIP